MIMNGLTNFICFTVLSFFALVTAFPVVREVYTPPVILPDASTVWVVGNQYNVTWNVTDAPPLQNITDRTGFIVLAKGGDEAWDNNTLLELASGFSILSGTVEVTCPKVPPANDYAIVLFGDSGNFGNLFTIAE
ncbi:uncharacterized protein FIBRA_08297 [Fibroporia radiculosa]|uniref:Yeast cell wall synthesis Kre9/Knh1-like N-terminal domain-containing protein n=1 Tax=Fibroporia radiculosa TaxID=599839 RepID=J4GWJ0_9APHY|nr:uncharacterized protein FIBRA_08297 [Fibroporia radiculosa]CCM06050.1 predicted protein [Fibroporia radiculosa]